MTVVTTVVVVTGSSHNGNRGGYGSVYGSYGSVYGNRYSHDLGSEYSGWSSYGRDSGSEYSGRLLYNCDTGSEYSGRSSYGNDRHPYRGDRLFRPSQSDDRFSS